MRKEVSFLIICPQGLVTSVLMRVRLEKILKQEGISVSKMAHCSCAEGRGSSHHYDIICCPKQLESAFSHATHHGSKIIALQNVLCSREMLKKLKSAGLLLS